MGSACHSNDAVAVENPTAKIPPRNQTQIQSKLKENEGPFGESSEDDFEAGCGKIETRAEASKGAKLSMSGKGYLLEK